MILFADGFDSYSVSTDLTSKWTTRQTAILYSATGGLRGGGALTNQVGTSFFNISKTFSGYTSSSNNIYFSFWIKTPPVRNALSSLFRFDKGSNQTCLFSLNGEGGIRFSNNSTVYDIPWTKIDDYNWHHIECAIKQNTATAANNLRIWIDGIQRYAGSHATTSATNRYAPDRFSLFLPLSNLAGSTLASFIDDLIVWDDQTTFDSFTTVPMGPHAFDTLRPNAIGSSTQLSKLGSTENWDCINEIGPDQDTSFVYGTGTDLYQYSDLSVTPVSIYALAINSVIKIDTSGLFAITHKLKSGGVTEDAAQSAVSSTTYSTFQSSKKNDPNTGAAFTQSGLNNAEFGFQVQ